MAVIYYIAALIVIIATVVAYRIGYFMGRNAKRLVIESLDFNQAMKWWAYHELARHYDDIKQIRSDLKKLANVPMPTGVDYDTWVDVDGNPKDYRKAHHVRRPDA